MRLFVTAVVTAFFTCVGFGAAHAQSDDIWRAGARVNTVASGHENLWAAGAIVSARGSTRENVHLVGGEIDAEIAAGRDLWAAGAIVTASGNVARDLYVAGARVTVNSQVNGTARVAGARVVIGAQSIFSGRSRIAGADVVFAGTAKGDTEIYGDSVRIDGRMAGNLRVVAREVSVGGSAQLAGDVRFETFNEPVIEEGAQISGRQTVTLPQPRRVEPEHVLSGIGAALLFAVGAGFLLGVILLAGARDLVERSIAIVREAPVQTSLIGLAILILLPLAALVVTVTIVGIPIGLLTLLAFPLLLFIASVLTAFALSDRLFNRAAEPRGLGARLLYLVGGLLILVVLGLVPFLGFVIWVLAVIAGLGALWQAMRSGKDSGAAMTA